jgi:protein SCO1/2
MKKLAILAALAAAPLIATPVRAEAPATRPSILNEVTIDQKLGDILPLQLPFRDEAGSVVKLASLFRGKPVIVVPVYYQCPMLCNVTLNQLNRSLNVLSESAGDQFDIITVSFDPNEKPELAAAKKRTYLKSYRRDTAENGWHFLTGESTSIDPLMKAIGFKYEWDDKYKVFAHAATVIVASPTGKISKYFLGVDYPPTELREAIKEAGEGVVAHAAPQIFLYCFMYDPNTGKYGLVINRSLQAFGALTVVGLIGLFFGLNHVRHRHERATEQAGGQGGAA